MASTAPERHLRHRDALMLLAEGHGVSAAITRLMDKHGCTRQTARRAVVKAHTELIADLEPIQVEALLASLTARLERIAERAEHHKQYGAAVGAARTLAELLVLPHRKEQPWG